MNVTGDPSCQVNEPLEIFPPNQISVVWDPLMSSSRNFSSSKFAMDGRVLSSVSHFRSASR